MLSVVGLMISLFIGVPIFISLGLMATLGIMAMDGISAGFALLAYTPYSMIASYLLVVVPLFILMGHLAFESGATQHAFEIARKWLSRFPAGLALATIMASAALGAACGSSVAASATLGRIAIPEMRNSGYDPNLACGCVAAGGLLAIMIPPSIILVIYAILTNTSVGACLIGGLIPGLLSTLIFMVGISFIFYFRPGSAPPVRGYSWKERFQSLRGAWGIIVLFITVIGGMYAGFFTPTEAAAGGALGGVMLLLIDKGRRFLPKFRDSMRETVRTTVFIFIIMVCAGLYSEFLIRAGVGRELSAWVVGLDLPPTAILLIVLAMYIPLGCFLDPTSCLLITLPIVHPIVVGKLGFDSVWFGILVTKLIEIGLITPPVGLNVYTIAGVAPDVPLTEIFKGTAWFILLEIISLAILIWFPGLTTWLPNMMFNP